MAADWAVLVVALLVAYDAGGAVLVGLVSLVRMVPATAVNLVVDTGRFRRRRTRTGRGQPPAGGRARSPWRPPASRTRPSSCSRRSRSRRRPRALVRPTVLTLLPQVAASPGELVSANTAGALGESAGTFAGPLVAGLRGRPARGGAGGAGLGRAVRAGRRGRARDPRPEASRPSRRERAPRLAIPVVAGVRELVARRPAGMVMTSMFAQTVRPRRPDHLHRDPRHRGPGHGRRRGGVLGAAIGLGGIVGALAALGVSAERRLATIFVIALVAWGTPIAVIGFVPITVVAILRPGDRRRRERAARRVAG